MKKILLFCMLLAFGIHSKAQDASAITLSSTECKIDVDRTPSISEVVSLAIPAALTSDYLKYFADFDKNSDLIKISISPNSKLVTFNFKTSAVQQMDLNSWIKHIEETHLKSFDNE